VPTALARARPNVMFYALILLFALLAPRVAAFGFFAVAIAVFLRPARRGRGWRNSHT
jgi:hypothetical protein